MSQSYKVFNVHITKIQVSIDYFLFTNKKKRHYLL